MSDFEQREKELLAEIEKVKVRIEKAEAERKKAEAEAERAEAEAERAEARRAEIEARTEVPERKEPKVFRIRNAYDLVDYDEITEEEREEHEASIQKLEDEMRARGKEPVYDELPPFWEKLRQNVKEEIAVKTKAKKKRQE